MNRAALFKLPGILVVVPTVLTFLSTQARGQVVACPFKDDNVEIEAVWKSTGDALTKIKASNVACQNALAPVVAGLRNPDIAKSLLDPLAEDKAAQARLENLVSQLSNEAPRARTKADQICENSQRAQDRDAIVTGQSSLLRSAPSNTMPSSNYSEDATSLTSVPSVPSAYEDSNSSPSPSIQNGMQINSSPQTTTPQQAPEPQPAQQLEEEDPESDDSTFNQLKTSVLQFASKVKISFGVTSANAQPAAPESEAILQERIANRARERNSRDRARECTTAQNIALGLESQPDQAQREVRAYPRRVDDQQARANLRASQAATMSTFTGVSGLIRAIPGVERACQGSDQNISTMVGQAGLNIFSSAYPLIFGAGSPVGAVASLLSDLVGALQGPSMDEKALEYRASIENLENISCLYFATMRLQCNLLRDNTGSVSSRSKEKLSQLRSQFEDPDVGALGKRMRNLFATVYEKKRTLSEDERLGATQYCALMSAIPWPTKTCGKPGDLGGTYRSCAYIEYFEKGGGKGFPQAKPSGPLSAPVGFPGDRSRGNGSRSAN